MFSTLNWSSKLVEEAQNPHQNVTNERNKMLKSYFEKIYDIANRGDDREESYYSVLAELLKNYAESIGKKNIHITIAPKKTSAGNPDFRVWDGKQHIVGYIEAKALTNERLELVEDTEQLERYRNTFPNLILTNYFEFRLYRNGEMVDKVSIARPFILHRLKTVPPVENENDFNELLSKFFSFSLPKVYDAKNLAIELAKRTRFLKDEVISDELKEDGFILGFYEAFQKYLIGGLTEEEFANLYSQTITYGLFVARSRSEDDFNRKLAYDKIPYTIGILRDVFEFVSLGKLPQQMEWIVDDISEVLAVTDLNKIFHSFFIEGKGDDPIVHFYETFLAEYDPQTREKRGVYYTPEPVVSYIVKSLHHILKEHFNRQDGLANDTVTVLDPAAGTLTFLAEATKLAVKDFAEEYGEGGKESFIKNHILKNFYAFELMMAPYAVGHLKMSFLLEELGYKLKKDDRFKLYLTNTLETEELEKTQFPGMTSLSEESHLAGRVKKEQPILVILGNPPYSGNSANLSEKEKEIKKGEQYIVKYNIVEENGLYKLQPKTRKASRNLKKKQKTWIGELIEHYKIIDGHWLEEKNIKWLQDDYVKFIRFAQWKIDQAGEGALGFITNHSYLDNPTFRGMRQSLMNSFNKLYILDLHGNSLKKEKCPDGSKDENVFDIQQGVAIALFIKKKDKNKECKVYHSEIWGLREEKYERLLENNIKTTDWQELSPTDEFYFFIPRGQRFLESYKKYPKITEVFPVNSVGIVTSRDNFVIDFDREVLERRIRMFRNKEMPDELIRQTFKLKDKSNWKLKIARENIRQDEKWKSSLSKILYRPFDTRWIFYHDEVIERSRKEVMLHMIQENLGLITRRQMLPGHPCNYFFASNLMISDGVIRSDNKGGESLFPLYIYPDLYSYTDQKNLYPKNLLSHIEEQEEKRPNISSKIIAALSQAYKLKPSPEEIFYYIYALFYSNIYRKKYAEFLKVDFPRVPFTKDYEVFIRLGEYGEKLVDLHLLKSDFLTPPIARFQGQGNNRVAKSKCIGRNYKPEEKRVYINKDKQYFEGIEPDVWEYQIGGYQVLDKWLKDRREKKLSLDEIKHYCKIITALKRTIEIQEEIDNIYPEVENGGFC